jgi:hypothetical protein
MDFFSISYIEQNEVGELFLQQQQQQQQQQQRQV